MKISKRKHLYKNKSRFNGKLKYPNQDKISTEAKSDIKTFVLAKLESNYVHFCGLKLYRRITILINLHNSFMIASKIFIQVQAPK